MFINIDISNFNLLSRFIGTIGSSGKSFRYFESRDMYSCIDNHEKTILLIKDKEPIGYGHLDRDTSDKKLWLGICLIEGFTGKGYGKLIMQELLKNQSENIYLSVDKSNKAGYNLYEKFGFKLDRSTDKIHFMTKHIND